ncbi:MAG: hypothetical protein DRJ61_08410 [Acidobacteria bacterium]|nr:MAG: hypothetical protein DRJ65_07455 [Acidobacteriota bacterium]RLE32905.1 MAG: hypothetical protein DRJ61_08410 [Acidobacteriota bacterium]
MICPRVILAASAVVLGLSGCGESPPDFNVLLLTLDTTRADHLGCYGYESAHTPRLDQFARERAVRFEYALTPVPITLPSHTSILTGTYPVFHGVHDNDGFIVDDELTTLAEILSKEGFATGAAIAAYPLDSQFNLDQGFDEYNDEYQQDWSQSETVGRTARTFGFLERTADLVNLAAFRWLESHGDERFFLWMHYFDPHQAYSPPAPFDTQFADSKYDGEIAFADENFGKVLDELDRQNLLDRTIIVVVGDHGEALDQHNEPTHAAFIYDATMRIPLLISAPLGGKPLTGVVNRQVQTIDIAPTILELLGLPAHPDMQGTSLVRDLREPLAQHSGRPALLESSFCLYHFGWAPLRGLRTDRWKYVLAPKPELYDLESDPGEFYNLVSSMPERAAEMDAELERAFDEYAAERVDRSAATVIDSEVREKLAALGYLGGGGVSERGEGFPSREALASMPNPVDRGLALSFVNSASEMVRQEEFETALEAAHNGLAADPGNFRLRLNVGQALLGLGNFEKAITELDRAAQMKPSDGLPHVLLGHAYVKLGRYEEARASFQVATRLERNSVEVLETQGAVEGHLGLIAEAAETFERALEIDGSRWSLHLRYAVVLADLGRRQEARSSFQEALRLKPYSTLVLDKIGLFYLNEGDVEFARKALEQAVRTEPGDPVLRLHLAGVILKGAGDKQEAREQLMQVVRLAPDTRVSALARLWLDGGNPDLLVPAETGD